MWNAGSLEYAGGVGSDETEKLWEVSAMLAVVQRGGKTFRKCADYNLPTTIFSLSSLLQLFANSLE